MLLEDQAGFIQRDLEFEFALVGQALGPVELFDEDTVTFQLALPAVPQGALTDLDNDGETDPGVQVFAVAYWSNTWGGPFLEARDGRGWSGRRGPARCVYGSGGGDELTSAQHPHCSAPTKGQRTNEPN